MSNRPTAAKRTDQTGKMVMPTFSTSERTSSIFLSIGAKKTGKTQASLSIQVDMFKKQNKPVLVFDVNNQSEYKDYKVIQLDELKYFGLKAKQETFPFFVCRDADDIDKFFTEVHVWIRNSFVVFEDSTSYMGGNLSIPVKKLILNSRNACNDYLFNLHSLAEPAPFLYRHAEFIILRNTSDQEVGSKIPARRLVEKAMLEIKAENKRLYPLPEQPKLAFRLIDITAAE